MFLPYRLTKRTPINRIPSNKPFPLEWLHQHLSEIVDIWCIKEETFDINWIKDDTLRAIISQNKGFQANIINIHDYIRNLPVITDKSALRKQLKDAFLINNQIEKLCKGKLKPILYDDLQLPTAQKNALKDGICTYLNESLQKTTAYTDNYETFKAYFDRIIKESKITVCPFCGLERLKSQYDNGRNAFDHYFAKSEYPFTAINTDNTFPICDECNSTENKGSNKVLFDEKNQRCWVRDCLAARLLDRASRYETTGAGNDVPRRRRRVGQSGASRHCQRQVDPKTSRHRPLAVAQ